MSRSKKTTRRTFLRNTAASAATVTLIHANVWGANDKPSIGIIGCGGRGTGHVGWANKSGGQVVAVCDADLGHAQRAAKKAGGSCKTYQDLRKLLADKSIDAVVIATPNHWHSLATVWSVQAGKDVYVEKPACHSIWEGRQMVLAARKNNKIVQIGTQQRSDPAFITLRKKLAKKELGEVQWIHSLWYAHRGPIGKVTKPTPIPEGVDYSLWCGPRKVVPLMRKKLHYDWHWFWPYGNGDMGNRVIHTIDDVHHVMQMNHDVPTRMMAVGGRFKYDDDATTPNTEFIVLDWKVPIIFGSRNLPYVDAKTGKSKGTSVYRRFGKGFRFTNLIKCENGFFAVSRGGGAVFDNDGKQIEKIKGDGGAGHMKNWLGAVKSRNCKDLHADVEQGHYGCMMLHTGNISYRVGKPCSVGGVSKAIQGEEPTETWKQTQDHLKRNGVDLAKEKPILGPWLTFDPKAEKFTGDCADEANKLVKEDYRAEFSIKV